MALEAGRTRGPRQPEHGTGDRTAQDVEPGPAVSRVVYVRGEVDISNVRALEALLSEASRRTDSVVVDLADATFIDASVLSVLARANAWLAGGLRVRGASPFISRVFALVEMEHLLTGTGDSTRAEER